MTIIKSIQRRKTKVKDELFKKKKKLLEHNIKRSRKESRAKGYRQGYNRRLWYHLLHKAVKYGARLFRSILDEEAVRKIFTSIYTQWPLFSFLSFFCNICCSICIHACCLLHNCTDSFTLVKILFLPTSLLIFLSFSFFL